MDTLLLMFLSFVAGLVLLKILKKREEGGEEEEPAEGGKRTRMRRSVQIAVWQRDRGECPECASTLKLARITPLSEGGSSTPKNIRVVCHDCGWGKRDRKS